MRNLFTFTSSSASRFAALLLLVLSPLLGRGQNPFTATTLTYSQNFDGMGATGTGYVTNWSGIRYAGTGTINATLSTLTVLGATSNAGNVYNAGAYSGTAAQTAERALGTLASGTTVPAFGTSFINNTGSAITQLDLTGFMEQWRTGDNVTLERVVFEYSLDATNLNSPTAPSASTATWTPIPSFDLVEIAANNSTTAGPLDGNAAANRVALTASVTGLTIPNGATFFIRWRDKNDAGSDGVYAIDDFSISATLAPPAPEINVQQAGADVLTGATYTFASTNVGSFTDAVFKIQNTGNAALTVGAGTFTGEYALAPSSTLPSSIAAGSSANFTVRFTPTTNSTRTGKLSLVNDDSNENPYVINFSGLGVAAATPSINVTNSPAFTAFATTAPAPSAAQTYTVQAVNLTNALVVTAPAGFEVSKDGTTYASSLNLGTADKTYTISVRLTGTTRGTFSSNVTNESTGANTPNDVAVVGTTAAAAAIYYLKTGFSDPAIPANFNTVADGSGITLTGFDVENATLILTGPASLSPSANIGGMGANSKFVLGDGTTPIALTLPATGAEFTAKIDLSANTTLLILDDTPTFTYGTIAATSSVDYAQAGTVTVPALTFGNLKLTSGTKLLATGTSTVRGNLVVDGVLNFNGAGSPFSTIDLKDDFTLLNGTTFDANPVSRFTLQLSSGTTQTLTGNGSDFALFRLTTTTAATKAVLATVGGSSNLVLGNTGGGGYTLATNTTLALNGNSVTFFNGNTTIGGTGTLINTTNSNLVFNHTGATALGTLRLGAGERPASLTLNATGTGATLTLPSGTAAIPLTLVVGGLNLTAGTLVIGTNSTLQVDGATTATATGLVQGSSTSSLSFTGASASTAALTFTTGAGQQQLKALALNQAGSVITITNSLTAAALSLTAGNLAIGGGATLTLTGPVTIGSGQLQGSSTSSLSFTGASTVTGTLVFAAGTETLQNLTLNLTNNLLIPVGSTLTIGTLTLTKGSLLFASGERAIVGTLAGGSVDSFVNALTLQTAASAAHTLTFPLGAALNRYRPLTFDITQTNATATPYTARVTEQNTNSRTVVTPLKRVSSRRFFTVTQEGITNFVSGKLTLNFGIDEGVTDLTTLRIGLSLSLTPYVDVNPAGIPAATTTGTPNVGSITDVTTALGDFALATTATDPTINPLPVELTSFSAQRQADNAVAVNWTTASERNSAYFDVQRSLDGRTFARIATVTARGNSTQATSYAALDKSTPAGTLYYRLHQVDADGKAIFSQVVSVSGQAADVAVSMELVVYPNPTAARIIAALPAAEGRTYRVLNALGQVVRQGVAEAAYPSVDVRQLPAGLYFLELHTAAGSQVRRFMKND